MHFVTGGAFNGKRKWVKKLYQVHEACCWISAYENHPFPASINDRDRDFLVLEGIELWLKQILQTEDVNNYRDFFRNRIHHWLEWEMEKPSRKLVIIGTDISKGIVPLEKENRLWRDFTGWVYQDLVAKAERVDVIWYGINQIMKGQTLQ